MDRNFMDTAAALEARFAQGVESPWGDDEFDGRARTAFRLQYEACRPYRAFCDARGATPGTVERWEEVPAVPASAFKYFDFLSEEAGPAEAVFRTSGTTRGATARGRHHVPRLRLYRASLLPPLKQALVPEGGRITFVSLIPSPDDLPDSSLSYMVGAAADALADETHWLVDGSGAWRADVADVLGGLAEHGAPVLLLGTALAFQHALEAEGPGRAFRLPRLPEGSRVMETGGFKGATRRVSRDALYGGVTERTGIPRHRIVNEYGMTELLSQLWEPVLTEGPGAAGVHVPPPWLRVRALDPTTLAPLGEGEEGLLSFFDLANLGSVSHVLTEDVGSVVDGRVRLRGRAPGAEPRGCSRAMDELMSAAGGLAAGGA